MGTSRIFEKEKGDKEEEDEDGTKTFIRKGC